MHVKVYTKIQEPEIPNYCCRCLSKNPGIPIPRIGKTVDVKVETNVTTSNYSFDSNGQMSYKRMVELTNRIFDIDFLLCKKCQDVQKRKERYKSKLNLIFLLRSSLIRSAR